MKKLFKILLYFICLFFSFFHEKSLAIDNNLILLFKCNLSGNYIANYSVDLNNKKILMEYKSDNSQSKLKFRIYNINRISKDRYETHIVQHKSKDNYYFKYVLRTDLIYIKTISYRFKDSQYIVTKEKIDYCKK